MKVTICKGCGLTMTAGVNACRRCKKKDLNSYDILCEDTYRLHKRVSQLMSENRKASPYTSPLLSAMIVLSVSSLAIIGYDYFKNPDGIVAKQAQSIIAMLPTVSKSIAKSKSVNSL